MPAFTDKAGRTWTVAIDIGAIRRVRDRLGINLADGVDVRADSDAELFGRLARDPVLLVDTLFVLAQPQAEKMGITDEQFAAGLDGPVLDTAVRALLDGICDFFQSPAAKIIQRTFARAAARDEARTLTEDQLDSLVDRVLDIAVREAASRFGMASGSSPASPASIPAA